MVGIPCFSCLSPTSQAGRANAAHAFGARGGVLAQEPWHRQRAPNQARMQEMKYLLPVTSARAWQAAWDSPLMRRAGTAERRM